MYPQKRLTIADLEKPLLPDHPVMADIDAHAAAVLHESAKAIEAILQRRAAMDHAGQADQTLFVLLGENHAQPPALLAGMQIIDTISKQEPTVCGLEYSHDFTAGIIAAEENIRRSSPAYRNLAANMAHLDADGAVGLDLVSCRGIRHGSHYTGYTLHDYFARAGIPVRFTDVSHRHHCILRDESSHASMIACRHQHSRLTALFERFTGRAVPTDTRSPAGAHIRNHHMAALLTPFAARHRARIAFQMCGLAHVTGAETPDHQYLAQHSLQACLREQGAAVAGILFNASRKTVCIKRTPEETPLFLSGLPSVRAVYDPHAASRADNRVLGCIEHESAYVDEILRQTGMTDHIVAEQSHEQITEARYARAQKNLRTLTAAALPWDTTPPCGPSSF